MTVDFVLASTRTKFSSSRYPRVFFFLKHRPESSSPSIVLNLVSDVRLCIQISIVCDFCLESIRFPSVLANIGKYI